MEYTPGPWEYCELVDEWMNEKTGPYGSVKMYVRMGGKLIHIATNVFPSIEQDNFENNKANAHLIAAAPEMYEALKRIQAEAWSMESDRYYKVENIREIVGKILAKAEGGK